MEGPSITGISSIKIDPGVTSENPGLIMNKVQQLERTMKIFRAEMDMKMKIMEQILNTRNEQFAVQKRLLEREQCLYQTVLEHWTNTSELAANGLSLQFSSADWDVEQGDLGVHVRRDRVDSDSDTESLSRKSSAAAVRRARRNRLKAKRRKADAENLEQRENLQQYFSEEENERSPASGGNEEMDSNNDIGELEHRRRRRYSRNPIWQKFVETDDKKGAVCLVCRKAGEKRVLKLSKGSTTSLYGHLRGIHGLILDGRKIIPNGDDVYDKLKKKRKETLVKTNEEGEVRETKRIRKNCSWVWNYFQKDPETRRGVCNLCKEQGDSTAMDTYGSSTSILHWHLKRKHHITPASHFLRQEPEATARDFGLDEDDGGSGDFDGGSNDND